MLLYIVVRSCGLFCEDVRRFHAEEDDKIDQTSAYSPVLGEKGLPAYYYERVHVSAYKL